MPAYVVAYAYTDFLQFSGPLQVALREALGLQGRLWPDVRSVWGAALVFTSRFTLMCICWPAPPWWSGLRV
jgi:iron(III) transport system permease protein